MNQLLKIEILDNGLGGHKDLSFKLDKIVDENFDTYYFALDSETIDSNRNIESAISSLLQSWYTELTAIEHHETIYLPVDFSDQYIGCLRVLRHEETLTLNYGFTNQEGYTVSPTYPIDFYRRMSDFESDSETLVVQFKDFAMAIESQIKLLQKSG
jgi:hypothetical protein